MKADGLVFKYTKCEICGLNVSDTSLRLVNSARYTSADSKDWNLVMFDCSRESNYNHSFHKSCLRKAIKEELRKNKKASLTELNVLQEARCVVCYRQSQSIAAFSN